MALIGPLLSKNLSTSQLPHDHMGPLSDIQISGYFPHPVESEFLGRKGWAGATGIDVLISILYDSEA